MKDSEILQLVKRVLFPMPRKTKEFTGHIVNYYISADALDNLTGAIESLKRENADKVSINTLERIEKQLISARDLLKDVCNEECDD